MRLDSSIVEAGGSGTAKDPLKDKVTWMVRLQTQHCSKTELHSVSGIGCFYVSPTQCITFQPTELCGWASALVSCNIDTQDSNITETFI